MRAPLASGDIQVYGPPTPIASSQFVSHMQQGSCARDCKSFEGAVPHAAPARAPRAAVWAEAGTPRRPPPLGGPGAEGFSFALMGPD